ncbi:YiiX/YebB-like N1pC/P60 family cysteine hydrolase [Aminivibrio sp.]|jgi:hypothetical protein|uniref:YiiX/YebB-like N1pC/P60 family cysteine hydrolase n=1 Tax=Aminivibrio sp. TaxID=1872489 RepID=UPI001A3A7E67|nr:YiiX/YebB-like N1pC/P60 family cysteine hydrolase [Aminivibrio sp.]MBL3538993.1 hypothetical protein [Aminivibrio sp.]MDK2958907.1 hypothetical protein [Synergistaceae bacterium]
MKRRFLLHLFLVLLLSSAAAGNDIFLPSHAPGSGDALFDFLLSVTNPDSLELRMDEPPDGDGRIRHASFVIRGACFGGLRVEKIAAEFFFLELNAPHEWRNGRRHSLRVNGVLRTNAEVAFLDKDINAALGTFPASRGSISIQFTPGSVRVLGLYGTEQGRFRVEMASPLAVEDGSEIVLEKPGIRVNGHDRTDAFRKEIAGLNPLLDLRNFPLPAARWILRADNGVLTLSTPVPPKAAEGMTLRYERGVFSLPAPQPFKFSPEQFQNGDIIFVNGKSWRSKALLFFFKSPADYFHSGMVRWSGGVPYVVHASPESDWVEMEPLAEFLSPFEIERAAVYRLKGKKKDAGRASGEALEFFLEKRSFDGSFDKHDEEALYCTELIWKACEKAGIDLFGEGMSSYFTPVPFYGNVLFPSDLAGSPLLEKVMTLED